MRTPSASALLTPPGWEHASMSTQDAIASFFGIPTTTRAGIPPLPGMNNHYNITIPHSSADAGVQPTRTRGWQRPGPGPRRGRVRIPSIEDLRSPFLMGVIHLAKEAVHFQQIYSFHSESHYSSHLELSTTMSSLAELEDSLTVSRIMKKYIWTLTHQLGVPALLLKLKSPYHAMTIHLLPDKNGLQWSCSLCPIGEVTLTTMCVHAQLLNSCIVQISGTLSCSTEYLVSSMTQSAAFHLIPDLPLASFYGTKKKHEFAVLRNELRDRSSPITSASRVHIVRRLPAARGWRCLNRMCAGLQNSCTHRNTVEAHVDRGLTHCFSNVFDILGDCSSEASGRENSDKESESSHSLRPQYSRPLVPSQTSFEVEFNVNKNARNGTTMLLSAAAYCHCGYSRHEEHSTTVSLSQLRVETTRCFVNYQQELWKCRNGHLVTPEHNVRTREGLVWISRDTAYTEVFLFDLLLHITVGGATLSSQSDIRAQVLSLQTEYLNRDTTPRSHHSVRKALISYTMAVVQEIPAWVFRCSKCATFEDGKVYYDKLSFDGQQVGFNITKDVRYDFYGKPSTPWRRPVERNAKAAKIPLLIQSRALRTIVFEALRVREKIPGSNSVQSLCRATMGISLRSKDSIRAAVAAIKLFDPGWTVWLPNGTPTVNEGSYEQYMRTSDAESYAHPIQFIANDTNPSPADFHRGLTVTNIFRYVLDCRRPAQVLAVLVNELRGDLKNYIPLHDKQFLITFAEQSNSTLHSWLCSLSHSNSWPLVMPDLTTQQIQQVFPDGIAEHIDSLHHPVRPPVSWHEETFDYQGPAVMDMFSGIRSVETWICPRTAQTAVLMLFMALLNEPVNVWLRDRRFAAILAGIEVLRIAEVYCGDEDVFTLYSTALQTTHSIGLLYEGLIGVIGASIPNARHMFAAIRQVLELVPTRQRDYEIAMRESTSTKQFMCTTTEFDDMLYWTGAVFRDEDDMSRIVTEKQGQHHTDRMRNLYDKIARTKSNDFLETGVWAPDFPIRRPSPSSSMWGTDTAHTEVSCSKDYDTHKAFSPGTFGAHCICKHAKTLMVTFLKRPEGCRMPLNAIVERCTRLPRYVIYDFACGTQAAAASLSAEITKNTRFVVDPFHFPGHKTCSIAMHESSYVDLRGKNMESQEQRNSNIKNMERTLRATKDVQFMHLVVVAHAYFNLKAMFFDHQDDCIRIGQDTGQYGSSFWIRWVRDVYHNQNN